MESHSILKNICDNTVLVQYIENKIYAVSGVETNDQYIVINLKYELDDIH